MKHQPQNRRLVILFVSLCAIFASFFLISTLALNADSNGDYALDFDGTTDMVRLSETSNMLITPTWTTTKTVTLWVRPESSSNCTNALAVAHCDNIFGDRARWWGISIGYSPNRMQDQIWVWNADGNEDVVGVDYTLGEWVHIGLVHEGGVLRAFKNGVEVGNVPSGPTSQPNTGALPILYIGGIINNSSRNWTFEGQIDEVRIWQTALSAADIRRDMFNTLPAGEPGLAAYYSMSDGSGTSLTDDSGNGWTGTIMDGGTGGVPGDGTFARWAASGAMTGPKNTLDFDGTDDYVDLVDNANTIIGGGWAGTKSVDVWVRPTGAVPLVTDAASGDLIIGGADWGISQANIAGDNLWVWNNDGNEDRIPLSYTGNEWTHISLVHAGGILTAYQDGVLAGSIASGNTASDAVLSIGGLSTGQNFQGQIDDLRIWSDARSLAEVQNYMLQTVEFDASGLAAYYRFDQDNEAGQTELVDSSTNGRHGTMINMDPGTDWILSDAFNTWVGGDTASWVNGGNWSQYATGIEHLGIARYPGSFTATVSTATVIDEMLVVGGANMLVTDTLTINNTALNRGTILNTGVMVADDISVTVGALLELDGGGSLTVNNVLDNYGTLKETRNIDGSSTINFFDTGGYGGLTIDPNGENMGDTVITIRGHQDCEGGLASVRRCFDIAPANSLTTGADLTFYFDDSELNGNTCGNLSVYHWNGTGWDAPLVPPSASDRNCVTLPYSLTVYNVTSFSPFVLAETDPTAVTLVSVTSKNAAQNLIWLPVILLLLTMTFIVIKKLKSRGDSFAA